MPDLSDFLDNIDGTDYAKTILECIRQLQWPYGAIHLGQVIAGRQLKKIVDQKHDQLPVFGAGREYSADQWKAWVNELVSQGYLTREPGLYPVIKLNERSQEITEGLARVRLSRPAEVKAAEVKPTQPQAAELPATYDTRLYEVLRIWRNALASEQGNPPYIILTNEEMKAICATFPRTGEELQAIKGIGKKKAESYGETIVRMVAAFVAENGLTAASVPAEAPTTYSRWGAEPLEAAYAMQEYIQSLQDELSKTKKELEELYSQIALAGKTESADYVFISEERYRRAIDQALFYGRYPEIFLRNARITLGSAQQEVEAEALEQFIVKEAHRSCKVEKKSPGVKDLEEP